MKKDYRYGVLKEELVRILRDGFSYKTYNPKGRFYNISFCIKNEDDLQVIEELILKYVKSKIEIEIPRELF